MRPWRATLTLEGRPFVATDTMALAAEAFEKLPDGLHAVKDNAVGVLAVADLARSDGPIVRPGMRGRGYVAMDLDTNRFAREDEIAVVTRAFPDVRWRAVEQDAPRGRKSDVYIGRDPIDGRLLAVVQGIIRGCGPLNRDEDADGNLFAERGAS